VNTYMQQRYQDKLQERNKNAQQATTVQDFITSDNVDDFSKPERLSKRLSRMGVASRRQAELLIEQRMVKVDGVVVTSNVPVTGNSLI
jgi:ribosomal protein S4